MKALKEINPLDILRIRRVKFCPPHFATANIERTYNIENAICQWVESNLSGRYFLGMNVKTDEENATKQVYTIGFENSKEISYFMLACPHLKY